MELAPVIHRQIYIKTVFAVMHHRRAHQSLIYQHQALHHYEVVSVQVVLQVAHIMMGNAMIDHRNRHQVHIIPVHRCSHRKDKHWI